MSSVNSVVIYILQYIYIDILQYSLASHTVIQQLPYMALLHISMYCDIPCDDGSSNMRPA